MSSTCENAPVKKEMQHKVAAEGNRIVDNVRYTDYRHHTEVDEATGTYIMDCSGFVSYVLKRVAPVLLGMIPKEVDQPRPRAFEYYEYFRKPESDGCWHLIHRLPDVQRGDVIAWRHPGPIEPHEDTGHVLIVAQTPVPVWRKSTHRNGEALETVFPAHADDIYSVSVYDSSDIPHNDDTRKDGVTGVGMGEIKFRTDVDGRPTSFQFNAGDLFYSYPIAIGRPEVIEHGEQLEAEKVERVEAEWREKDRVEREKAALSEKAKEVSYEQVQLRAYFISERRKILGIPGDETSDWVQAEIELKQREKDRVEREKAVLIKQKADLQCVIDDERARAIALQEKLPLMETQIAELEREKAALIKQKADLQCVIDDERARAIALQEKLQSMETQVQRQIAEEMHAEGPQHSNIHTEGRKASVKKSRNAD
jgi:hypothetical protein